MQGPPFLQRQALHGREGAALEAGIAQIELTDQLLYFLPLGGFVRRAHIFDERQIISRREALHGALTKIEHRAYLCDVAAAQIGDRIKAGQPALIYERHHESLNCIVIVVAKRKLAAAMFACKLIERPAAHA